MKDHKIEKVLDCLYLAIDKADNDNNYQSYTQLRELTDFIESILNDSYQELIQEYLQ